MDETVPMAARRRMTAELRAAEEHIALTALDALTTHIAILDSEGIILATNKAWREFGGNESPCCDRSTVGTNYFALLRSDSGNDSVAAFAEGVQSVLRGRREFSLEYSCQVGGQERWFRGRVTRCSGSGPLRVVIAHEEISQSVQLEREIVAVSAREQQRFGQELHDGLSQHLTGLKFKASLLEYQLQSQDLAQAADAKALSQLLNDATEEAAKLARSVRPVETEARGLMMALRELAATTSHAQGVKCVCHIHRPVFIHDQTVATNVYRIAEEAIANALQHGEAREILIDLGETKECAKLTVRDNGRGLPKNFSPDGGIGLHMMRYRARMIGGTVELRRNLPRGVAVTCTFQKRVGAQMNPVED